MPATGTQHVLHLDGPDGPVTAVVAELAASLRRVQVGGTDLVQDYGADALPSGASGDRARAVAEPGARRPLDPRRDAAAARHHRAVEGQREPRAAPEHGLPRDRPVRLGGHAVRDGLPAARLPVPPRRRPSATR